MNNLLNVRRPAQYATGRPAARVMPTISSDASSDNSEGGAPLHDKMTFSEMRMSQVERNRMQRDAVAAEASKVPDDHAAGPRLSDSSATASTFSAGEQKFKAGQGSRNHELNPASNMFIPSSATVNDLTKLQVSSCNHITSKPDLIASFVLSPTQTFTWTRSWLSYLKAKTDETHGKLLQMLKERRQSEKAATDEQNQRRHNNSFAKRANSGSHAGTSRSATPTPDQRQSFANVSAFPRTKGQQESIAGYHQVKQAHAYAQKGHDHGYSNAHGQRANGISKQADHTNGIISSGDEDLDTSAHAYTQHDFVVPQSTEMTQPATKNGLQTVRAYGGSSQCREIILFQSVDEDTRAGRSALLNSIVPADGLPTEAVLTHPDNCPFVVTAEASFPEAEAERGIVHIDNIPFGISRAEVIAFVGKNSRLLNDSDEPVHIIMDRVQGKTQDVYVEFATMKDAMAVVERHETNLANGRSSRLGDRPVRVYMSSPANLMSAIFSYARGVDWHGYIPQIREAGSGAAYDTFTAFVSDEELAMVAKHAEDPRRSPFSRDARERPYECMISTIKKFPWYLTDRITLRHRYNIYNCCIKLLITLQDAISRDECSARLTRQLLKRFINSMMLCPGFTVMQKDNFAFKADLGEMDLGRFNMPRFPDLWSHQYALGPRAGIPMDVIEVCKRMKGRGEKGWRLTTSCFW